MRINSLLSFFFLATVFIFGGCAPKKNRCFSPIVPPDKVLTVQQMQEDLEYVVDILGQVHPKTLKGFNERQNQTIKSIRAEITQPMPADQFYMRINRLFCAMKDGHTHLYSLAHKQNYIINASFIWLHDGLYVKNNSDQFKQGDRVLSIGGKSINDIFIELDTLIPSENKHWTYWKGAEVLRRQPYLETLGLTHDGYVDFQLQRGQSQITVRAPLTLQTQKLPTSHRPWVRYEIDTDDSLGVFYLDACRINDMYRREVNKFFREVSQSNIQNVVIDVRRNGGGNSLVVDEFLRYVDIDRYRTFSSEVRYSKASAEAHGTPSRGHRKFHNRKPKKNHKHKDSHLLFSGKLYILTSPQTFSSGNWFAVVIKDNQLGTVVGEPTGNQPSSYGDCLSFQMPNSGYGFSCSFKKWIRPNTSRNDEDALYPDIPVYTTIDDVIHQRDPQLDKIKKLTVAKKGMVNKLRRQL